MLLQTLSNSLYPTNNTGMDTLAKKTKILKNNTVS